MGLLRQSPDAGVHKTGDSGELPWRALANGRSRGVSPPTLRLGRRRRRFAATVGGQPFGWHLTSANKQTKSLSDTPHRFGQPNEWSEMSVEHETICLGTDTYNLLEISHDEGGRIRAEVTMEPSGGVIPSHCHPESHEVVSVIEGEIHVTLGGRDVRVGAGDTYTVPPGVQHVVRNGGTTTNKFFWEFTPAAGADQFLRDSADLGLRAAAVNAVFLLEEVVVKAVRGEAVSFEEKLREVGRAVDEAGGVAALIDSAGLLKTHSSLMGGALPQHLHRGLIAGLLELASIVEPAARVELEAHA